MHYMQDGPFEGPVKADDDTIVKVLINLAGMYQPIQGLTLKMADIRRLNRAIDILEGDPDDDGYFALEDEDFKVLKLVTITLAENSSLARSAPAVEDALDSAPTEKPESSSPSADGGSPPSASSGQAGEETSHPHLNPLPPARRGGSTDRQQEVADD